MTTVHDFILGSGDLHERLCAITELLGKLVAVAPSSLSLAQMKRHTGRGTREISKCCQQLHRDGLVTQTAEGNWTLAVDAAALTLEDVYRCAMAEPVAPSRTTSRVVEHHANHAVDLLLMQAAIAINQSLHQHLRQFSLDRLKPAASIAFPVSRKLLRGLDYNAVPDSSFAALPA